MGVKKGQTRVPLGHLSGSQQKKPEPTGMQPEGQKTSSSGSSFAQAILLSVLPMAINVERHRRANSEITQCAVCHLGHAEIVCESLCFVYFGTARADKVGAVWEGNNNNASLCSRVPSLQTIETVTHQHLNALLQVKFMLSSTDSICCIMLINLLIMSL